MPFFSAHFMLLILLALSRILKDPLDGSVILSDILSLVYLVIWLTTPLGGNGVVSARM